MLLADPDTETMDSDSNSDDDDETSAQYAVVQDVDEPEEHLDDSVDETYGSKLGRTPCSHLFPCEVIASTRMNCKEMTKSELDLMILANLDANQRRDDSQGQEPPRYHIRYRIRATSILY